MPQISHQFKSQNYDARPASVTPRLLVLHATVGSFVSARDWLCNPVSDVSSHYLIDRDGTILQLVADEDRAWHAGESAWHGVPDCNDYSIGIELANTNDGHDPYTLQLLASLRWLCQQLLVTYRLTPADIATHAMIALPPGRKTDPLNFPLPAFQASLTSPAPTPSYSPASPFIGQPLTTSLRWSGTKSAYDPVACNIIRNGYWTQAQRVGLDPILAFAQMLHETGNLTSWFSLRPRRNPAGLGVTGDSSPTQPTVGSWAYRPSDNLWYAGLSFATWADDAIPAHLGRLLGYALHPDQMLPNQKALFIQATATRPLPDRVLGCAPTLGQLDGVWAVPGDGYSAKIATIANQLLGAV